MDPGSTSIASESGEKEVVLPKQLEAVTKATSFPLERHRWNTNEEVAAILIAFEHHQKWQSREVKPRPASGSMLLYNRKKVRYRKDGYCWKKRKDGKTTREDHMKLKVQGVECIYGCYVHSAILPTFHRRCYWLLQNPDLVLVHYLNVPLQDENKLSLPSLQHVTEKKEWSRDDLVSQLRPMFPGAGDGTNNQGYSSQTEETVQSIVVQLMESQHRTECTCTNTTATCESSACKNKCRVISPKTQTNTATLTTTPVTTSTMPNRIMNMVQGQKQGLQVTTVTTPAQQRPVMAAGGASLIINSGNHRHLGTNTPLILNLSQLQGSNGLIILSSQSNAPISIVNNSLLGNNVASSSASSIASNSASSLHPANPPTHLMNSMPASSAAPSTAVSASLQPGQDPRQQEGQGGGHREMSGMGQGQHVQLQSPVLQGQSPQLPEETRSTSSPLCATDIKHSNGEVRQPQVLHGGLVLKEEVLDEEKSNISMEECTSRLQLMNHDAQVEDLQEGQRPMSEDLDSRMEIGQRGSYRDQITTENQPAAMDDIVSELNLKNEMQNFSAGSLVMSPDEIHKALTANLPVAGTSLVDHQPNAANQSTTSLDSIEAMRSSMVSPQSTDFNFDAFDILDVLPDFDSSDQMPAPTVTSSVTTTPRPTTAESLASTMASCTSCQNNNNTQVMLENKSEVRAGIANITDFSPEWSYAEGGVKVLVTGPWYSTTSPYTVLFDNSSVPATLVQSGVLRCFCPAHSPGLVTLQVACEGYVISNSCVFEYKAKPETVKAEGQSQWFGVQEDHLKMALLNKLEQIEKRLSADMGRGTLSNRMEGKMRSHDAFEVRLLDYVDQLSQCLWRTCYDTLPRAQSGLTLLHLVAALGYTRLTLALIKWRSENPSLILESEVDALSHDDRDNTPLMWACARGCLETAIVLYHWNPAALSIANRDKQSPLATARSYGNPHIAEHIERLEIAQLPKPSLQQSKETGGHQHGRSATSQQKSARTASRATKSQQHQEQLTAGLAFGRQSVPFSSQRLASEASIGGSAKEHRKGTGVYHMKGLFSFGDELESTVDGLLGAGSSPLVRAPGDKVTGRASSGGCSASPVLKTGERKQSRNKVLASSTPISDGSAWPPLRDLTIEIPSPPPIFDPPPAGLARGNASSQSTPSATTRCTVPMEAGLSRNMRLLKRTSVEVLPGYLDFSSEVSSSMVSTSTKTAKTSSSAKAGVVDGERSRVHADGAAQSCSPVSQQARSASATPSLPTSAGYRHSHTASRTGNGSHLQGHHHPQGQGQGQSQGQPQGHGHGLHHVTHHVTQHVTQHGLRSVSSDPHLVGLGMSNSQMLLCDDNPMISVNDRDLNSPVMFMQTDTLLAAQSGLTLEDIQRETVAMETDSPRSDSPYVDVEKISEEEEDLKQTSMSFLEQLFQSVGAGTEEAQSQIVTLANQIIAAMPERIKLSPVHNDDSMLVDQHPGGQRERSSSHSSFSSYSPAATPPCGDDSGISTPLEGLAFEEYRYPDLGTPASSLSPASSCLQSPYSFTLDSPPPTTAEFTEYFNAPTTFMEKDFSQLTLSDHEQRRLYEAAKIIQNFYRHYKDKKQQAQKQRQREIEAAILIQSYYRRYKQYAYYKKMTQAAVLIQSQFRSYYAQKRFKRSREAATVIQNQYRTYKEHERFKKSRNAAVIIQQRFRSHYQRKRSQEMARQVQKAVKSSHSSDSNVTATGVELPRSTDSELAGPSDGSTSLTTAASSASESLQEGESVVQGRAAVRDGTREEAAAAYRDGVPGDSGPGGGTADESSFLTTLSGQCHQTRVNVHATDSRDDQLQQQHQQQQQQQ